VMCQECAKKMARNIKLVDQLVARWQPNRSGKGAPTLDAG
jgi:hypothetical protein